MNCPNCNKSMERIICLNCGLRINVQVILRGKKFRLEKVEDEIPRYIYANKTISIEIAEVDEEFMHLGKWQFNLWIDDVANEVFYGHSGHYDSIGEIMKLVKNLYDAKLIIQTQKTLFSSL